MLDEILAFLVGRGWLPVDQRDCRHPGRHVTRVVTADVIALLVTSFGIGIVIGLTGMGGGALMTPALIFLGVPPTSAVANDLVAAAVNKSTGAAVHWREGSPHRGIATWLIAGSVPTAFAGAFIVRAAGEGDERDAFLKAAIGVTLLIAACTYALRVYVEMRRKAFGQVVKDVEPTVRPLPTLLVGAFGGLLVGITSVGSGSVIMVVLLVLYPALAGVRLVGTDLVQAVPLVTAAALSHVIVTGIDWSVLIPLVVGGTPGHLPRRPAGQPRLAVDRPPRHRAGAVPDRSEHAEGATAGRGGRRRAGPRGGAAGVADAPRPTSTASGPNSRNCARKVTRARNAWVIPSLTWMY